MTGNWCMDLGEYTWIRYDKRTNETNLIKNQMYFLLDPYWLLSFPMWFYQVSLCSQSLRACVHLSLAWSDIFIIVMSDWNDGELKIARIFLDFFSHPEKWQIRNQMMMGRAEKKWNIITNWTFEQMKTQFGCWGRVRWNSRPKKQIFYQNCSCGSFFLLAEHHHIINNFFHLASIRISFARQLSFNRPIYLARYLKMDNISRCRRHIITATWQAAPHCRVEVLPSLRDEINIHISVITLNWAVIAIESE